MFFSIYSASFVLSSYVANLSAFYTTKFPYAFVIKSKGNS